MAAGTFNFMLDVGDDWRPTITWSSGGTLVNLTGYTAAMNLRATEDSASVMLALTTANGKIVLGGTAGTIQLIFAYTDTAGLTPGTAVHELKLVNAAGVPRKLLRGLITIRKAIV